MFNEQSHAFIAAMYYNKLKERFGDTGVAAFTHATQQYGLQRGHRMALKALRDGKPLDIFSYREYGELIRTADAPETILEVESTSPDYVYRITACPWHMQFEKMGALEAALDTAEGAEFVEVPALKVKLLADRPDYSTEEK